MTNYINRPQISSSNEAFQPSKVDLIMKDLLIKQAAGLVYLPGDLIWESSGHFGWAETCTIVSSPMHAILNPDKLNKFMFSLTSLPYSAADITYRHGPNCDLPIPKLYFDEVLAKVERTIYTKVDQVLALRTDLRLDIPEEECKVEELNRRTWLYVYPDPTSAHIAHQVMTGQLQTDLMTYSQYHLSAEQVESIRRANRANPLKKLLGR